jgi:hypothetical protein
MANNQQVEPTMEEMKEAWLKMRQKQFEDITANGKQEGRDITQLKSPLQGRPIDPKTGKFLSYEDMKRRFLAAQGRGRGWQTPDSDIEHDISVSTPATGKPLQSFESMRERWYELQGKLPPEKLEQKWKDRLK